MPQRGTSSREKKSKKKAIVSAKGNAQLWRGKRNRQGEALERLGLRPKDQSALEALPLVSENLSAAEGGLPQVIRALRAMDDDDAREFFKKYDILSPTDRARIRIEFIAYAAGVTPLRLQEMAVTALTQQGETVSSVIAATSHPKIVEKSVQMALQDKGTKDREMMHQAMGFVPTPKGSLTVIDRRRIQVNNLTGPTGSAPDGPEESDAALFDDDLQKLHATHQKLIEAKT